MVTRLTEKEAIRLGIIKPASIHNNARDVVAEAMKEFDRKNQREPFDWDKGRAELEEAREVNRAIKEGVATAEKGADDGPPYPQHYESISIASILVAAAFMIGLALGYVLGVISG